MGNVQRPVHRPESSLAARATDFEKIDKSERNEQGWRVIGDIGLYKAFRFKAYPIFAETLKKSTILA